MILSYLREVGFAVRTALNTSPLALVFKIIKSAWHLVGDFTNKLALFNWSYSIVLLVSRVFKEVITCHSLSILSDSIRQSVRCFRLFFSLIFSVSYLDEGRVLLFNSGFVRVYIRFSNYFFCLLLHISSWSPRLAESIFISFRVGSRQIILIILD